MKKKLVKGCRKGEEDKDSFKRGFGSNNFLELESNSERKKRFGHNKR